MSKKFILLLFVVIQSCGDPCSQNVDQSVVSQNGVLKATSLVKNCGATTKTVVEVYVSPVGENYDSGVVVFRGEGEKITIGWQNDGELAIKTDAKPIQLMKKYFDVKFLLNGE